MLKRWLSKLWYVYIYGFSFPRLLGKSHNFSLKSCYPVISKVYRSTSIENENCIEVVTILILLSQTLKQNLNMNKTGLRIIET